MRRGTRRGPRLSTKIRGRVRRIVRSRPSHPRSRGHDLMRRTPLLLLPALTIAVALGSTRWGLLAQDAKPESARSSRTAGKGRVTVEDALLQPFAMPFAKETRLDAVAAHLHKALDAPVVLDRAA